MNQFEKQEILHEFNRLVSLYSARGIKEAVGAYIAAEEAEAEAKAQLASAVETKNSCKEDLATALFPNNPIFSPVVSLNLPLIRAWWKSQKA